MEERNNDELYGSGKKKKYHQGVFEPVNKNKYQGSGPIIFRSSWELKYMRFLDINEYVLAWGSETLKVKYFSPVDNRYHTYYPDFILRVRKTDGSEKTQIVEIKPSRQTKPPKIAKNRNIKTMMYESKTYAVNQAKWAAAKAMCESRGWEFCIITEKHL